MCWGGPILIPHSPPSARTCEEPASNPPHVWPDDITKWPVRARCRCELGGTVVAAPWEARRARSQAKGLWGEPGARP